MNNCPNSAAIQITPDLMHQAIQSKKLEFFTLENSKLKDQIEQLKDMIRVNKESIDILSQSQPQTTHAHHKHSTTLSIDDKPLRSEKNESGGLKEIIKKLNSKNTAILDELYKLQRENEELQTKMLLLEQVSCGMQDEEKRNLHMLESQLKSMSRNLVSTNEKLTENEKHRFQVDSMSGLAIKIKEVFSPSQQAMRFEQTEYELRKEICIRQMEIEKLKDDNRGLEKLNLALQTDLTKFKTSLLMPNRPLDKTGEASIKKLALYFLQAQRKVLEGEDSDSDFEDMEIMAPQIVALFPEKVQAYRLRKQKKPEIPKIDLTKIRELMKYQVKFVQADLKRRNKMPQTQRISILQDELDFTRRELTRTLLLLKQADTKNSSLQRFCQELEHRSRIANEAYESLSVKMVGKKKIQFRRPDLNMTMNPSMGKTSLAIHPKTRDTSNIISPSDLTPKEEFIIRLHTLSEDVCNLPEVNASQSLKPKTPKTQGLVRSQSNPQIGLEEGVPLPEKRVINKEKRDYDTYFKGMVEENRFQQNLDDIQV